MMQSSVCQNAMFFYTCFPNLHSDFSHVWDRGIGPVAMSTDEREELLGLAQIGLRTVLGEEGVDFVASLPVGHVGAKRAAIVARLIDENLGVELVFLPMLCLPPLPPWQTRGWWLGFLPASVLSSSNVHPAR